MSNIKNNNDNDNQNSVINEESATQNYTLSTVGAEINTTTISDSTPQIFGTQQKYCAETTDQIGLTSNASDVQSGVVYPQQQQQQQPNTQTNEGIKILSQLQAKVSREYLESVTDKSMFAFTDKEGKLSDNIAAAVECDEKRGEEAEDRSSTATCPCGAAATITTNISVIGSSNEDFTAMHSTDSDVIANTSSFVKANKRSGDHLSSIKCLTGKSIENTATTIAKCVVDVGGDGTQIGALSSATTNSATTTTMHASNAKDTDEDSSLVILVTASTTAKPPIPPTLPTISASPSLSSTTTAIKTIPAASTLSAAAATTSIMMRGSTQGGAIHLTHISSDPTFAGIQSELPRNQQQQQQKMKSFHDTKQTAMWSKDSVLGSSIGGGGNASIDTTTKTAITSYTGAIVRSGASSVTVSPCLLRKGSDPCNVSLPRRVSFPKSDNELVTGYLEPANPWGQACLVKSISEIAELYVLSCRKHKTKPLQTVLDHLKGVELNKQQRQPVLSLKSIKLAASDCEALEEIFKRVQYKFIDLSSCDLDEWATNALFEMIEYYEAAHELDISSNSKGMTSRGWAGCMAMVKHSEELRVLIAQCNPISKQSADGLGQAICTSNLHTLKLEHCGLRGALDGLCFKLRHNTSLKELWLAHNDLDYRDAESIGDLLKVNHYIELIDVSNNNIRDQGLLYIVEALILQSQELERRSMLQRSSAIDDDDSLSSLEASQTDFDTSDSFSNSNNGNNSSSGGGEENNTAGNSEGSDKLSELSHVGNKASNILTAAPLPISTIKDKVTNENLPLQQHQQAQTDVLSIISVSASATASASAPTNVKASAHALGTPAMVVPVVGSLDDMDGDDDTEETVKSSNQKNGSNAHSGKSMLDKLLSMNSESSSEEGASNLSTDTIAACGSEDVSITSDDIFETSIATGAETGSGAAPCSGKTLTTTTQTNASSSPDSPKNSNSNVKAPNDSVSAANVIAEKAAIDFKVGQVQSGGNIELKVIASSKIDAVRTTYDNSSNNEVASVYSSNRNDNVAARLSPLSSSFNNSNNNTTSSLSSNTDSNEDVCRKYKDSMMPAVHDQQDNQNQNILSHQQQSTAPNVGGVYEVTAGEGDCEPRSLSGLGGGGERLPLDHTPSLLQQLPTKAMDVNKNTKLTDDYDDTHSTDSAFESASEGDISRHLPEEYSRISTSFDGAPIDDIVKGVAIETGTIATESIEYLADAGVTPTSTPTPPSALHKRQLAASLSALDGDIEASCQTITSNISFTSSTYASVVRAAATTVTATDEKSVATQTTPQILIATTATTAATSATAVSMSPSTSASVAEKEENCLHELPALPKVTIASDSSFVAKDKEAVTHSPIPTPPPPSTSPGGASHGMRRTETSTAFITPATRHRSQSSDSLCSDNSLDGSISSDLNFSTSSQLNEKLTKNDTLTRQQRQMDPRISETTAKTPGGLKALALWNNNLSRESGYYISHLLAETNSLELLNIGKNCLSNDFVNRIKDSLIRNTTLTTLGLQSAHLSANGIETLASILTFGGNNTLQRLDIRDNKLEVESLTKIAEVLKSNTTITQIDIDDEPKRLSLGSEAHIDYTRVLENVRSMCSRNEKTQAQLQSDKSLNNGCGPGNKRRSGYYLGSRKISLTCHTRPIVVETTTVVTSGGTPTAAANNKLEAKRKTGARLRSPVPSPPTISPSSSPNRSRFQVFRVTESSPLTSPLAQTPPSETSSTSSLATNNSNSSSISMPADMSPYRGSVNIIYGTSSSLPISSSLPSMATVTSSTQSIKRFSASPRSRFLVSKIYEDPRVPLASRSLPPITPPIHLPPTPIAKHAPESAKLSIFCSPIASPIDLATVATATATKVDEGKAEAVVVSVDLKTATTSICSGDVTSTAAHKTTTLIVTPPTLAIVGKSGSDDSTNMRQCNQNDNLKAVDSTNIRSEKQSQQEISQLQPQKLQQQQQLEEGKSVASTVDSQDNIDATGTQSSNNNTLSPICSSSSSSSSSTSPASLNSTSSSSTSTSSPLSAIFSSSSSDSTDGCDAAGSEVSLREELLNATGTRCPLAMFNDNDNDITLTKNSAGSMAPVASAEESQQRQRKVSWMANPGAVDKLRSLFFQRSSSPETHATAGGGTPSQQPIVTNSAPNIPPNNSTTTVAVNNATAFNLADCTLSDAASQQLLQKFVQASQQLSKVFRQNLSFGNETATTTTTNTIAAITSGSGGVASSGLLLGNSNDNSSGGSSVSISGTLSSEQHNVTHIPTEIKQAIKENISPEHTINEETLHSYQKLTDFEGTARFVVQERQTGATGVAGVVALEDMDGSKAFATSEENNAKTMAVGGSNSASAATNLANLEETTATKGSGAAFNASAST